MLKRRWFENDRDWAISSQGSNRARFNDYELRKRLAKTAVGTLRGEDIV